MKLLNVRTGTGAPLGATVGPHGVNFSVFSKSATAIELLLFDDAQAGRPSRVVRLEPRGHRTYHYWHVFVPDLRPGQVYAYRAHGPFDPSRGLRFDAGVSSTRAGRDSRARMPGEAAHVHLVDHGARKRPPQREIAFPVIGKGIDDRATALLAPLHRHGARVARRDSKLGRSASGRSGAVSRSATFAGAARCAAVQSDGDTVG